MSCRAAIRLLGLAALVAGTLAGPANARDLVLATTTSVEGSGLLGNLLSRFREFTGITVLAVIAGTGQVLRIGRAGDADVLLTHDPESEARFVTNSWGIDRRPVMANDFLLAGPLSDPAGVADMGDVVQAFAAIARAGAPFLSRGDDSGTHKAERRLWDAAGLTPWSDGEAWYRETGTGQGATLNTAAAMGAYLLVDRGTWLAARNRGELVVLFSGDARLWNLYSVIRVNPARHAHIQAAAARTFADWLTGPAGQATIAGYQIDRAQPFHPAARPD